MEEKTEETVEKACKAQGRKRYSGAPGSVCFMKLNVQRNVYFSFIVNVRKSLTQPRTLSPDEK